MPGVSTEEFQYVSPLCVYNTRALVYGCAKAGGLQMLFHHVPPYTLVAGFLSDWSHVGGDNMCPSDTPPDPAHSTGIITGELGTVTGLLLQGQQGPSYTELLPRPRWRG